MKSKIIFFFMLCAICGCRYSGQDPAKDTSNSYYFISKFRHITPPFRNNGGEEYIIHGKQVTIKQDRPILKSDFAFLAHAPYQIPDTFYAAVVFSLPHQYLCMISGFNDSAGGNFTFVNSSLLLIDANGVSDMLHLVTFQKGDEVYKRCWIQNVGKDSLPIIVTRIAYGEGEGLSSPSVYEIINGKFKPAADIKIDTAAFRF